MSDRWQPIETAPKDGTKIMLYRERWGIGAIGSWGPYSSSPEPNEDEDFSGWHLEEGVYVACAMEEGFVGWNEDKDAMPTHWIALPPNDR